MNAFFLDAHCDTITKIMHTKESLYKNNDQVDIERLKNFSHPIQFFAIWMHPKFYGNPLIYTLKAIDYFYKEIEKNEPYIAAAVSLKEIERNIAENKISAVLTVEGGEALEGEIEILRTLYRLGVRCMTLTWNYQNCVGCGAMEEQLKKGLTDFGIEVVKEMNALGMLVDVSHLSESSFWDVKKTSSKPFIASHSNVREICNHPRNLSDKQLKAIADAAGVVGITTYPLFLNSSGEADIEDFFAHMDYMVKLIGIDYIGLGCDFDGIATFSKGLEDVSKLKKVCERLEKKYGCSGAEKILHKNFLRVIKEVWIE
ncbi:MAG: rane dipeptidase [Epulopiscium sp.]|jgi:membrane dipeptidase|uniref:Membrane dipeptidase n=1 Tax=Defluviitalea raffinosedens TaxID=1450156 RepID=A0A7C8HD80_9FIRM|nr:dipeptidase [Defluviitalea raffinosedens]MBZ4667904.1 Membrane dipeptidase [Defluviitaleaceae bacterium]MDK2787716.1 rane dipeptidase [Candidatus Epulonipiscium sp.]KAE9629819.1 membrane dipeptidase [Defluviitalea raffinosedens]MBM7686616.1 membrane dipeptidase [Defluviitalea raffinosedens]HHW67901.1 membrane dipeptidase [Candidatus Epulonipiscium sp.]